MYRNILLYSRHFTMLTVDTSVADRAAELRARYHLRTMDAFQVAAALTVGCQAILTNDAQLSRVTELRVLQLDELELDPR
jgi:predicted nucleic acid-binding protein